MVTGQQRKKIPAWYRYLAVSKAPRATSATARKAAMER